MQRESPPRHLILLISLILLFIVSPFIAPLRQGVIFLNVVGAAVLLSATYAVSERWHYLAVALFLCATSIVTSFWLLVAPSHQIVLVSHGSLVVLISFFAVTIVGYVARVMQMRYFSFITLATVGYGDIVPRTPAARTMAMLEAMLGQFYLVALIGRLVGLHIVHGSNSRHDEH